MNILIRPFQSDDQDDLMQVWEKANQMAHPFLKTSVVDFVRTAIPEQFLPNSETWIAENENRVVGFMALLSNEAGNSEVGAMFVDPQYQRCGIGRQLMDKAVALKKVLFLEVFEKNTIGKAFYEGYGFIPQSHHLHELSGEMVMVMGFNEQPMTKT